MDTTSAQRSTCERESPIPREAYHPETPSTPELRPALRFSGFASLRAGTTCFGASGRAPGSFRAHLWSGPPRRAYALMEMRPER